VADPSVENSWVEAPEMVTTNCCYCFAEIVVPLSVFDSAVTASCFDAGEVGCWRRFRETK
jgi:hypothetical protein